MSECVIRMEMPKNCYLCPMANFFVDKTPYCRLTMRFEGVAQMGCKRPDWCPILCQLPEGHGRLGDLDELAAGCDAPYWCRWLSEIEDAPTIVPADTAERSET